MATSSRSSQEKTTVGLFVTCLIDAMRPSAGMAALRLLEAAGCEVVVPNNQTCCGQPAWNSGDINAARKAASPFLDAFESCDYVVVPSGSCAGMLAHHLVDLFDGSADIHAQNQAAMIAAKTHELTSFLVDVMGMKTPPGKTSARIAYHDSCSSLREMQVSVQPRTLLKAAGAEVIDLDKADTCCGFGGTFSVKYGDISGTMSDDKAADIEGKNPDMLVAGDMGCLMNIAGRLSRRGSSIEVRHVAEVLDGMMEAPPIAASRNSKPGRSES
ncbi:MAG: (Fe-S)-binding protein [Alphaproteobacteria bacterium]|nr:(Fe-S)-binding protein [Alphaproteobacteria bacterium]